MKRLIVVFLTLTLLLTNSACGTINLSKSVSSTDELSEPATSPISENEEASGIELSKTSGENDVEISEEPSQGINTEDKTSAEMAELEAIGDVEVVNGILTVSIIIPKDIFGDVSQEDLDVNTGDVYQSAKINEDGSITFKMTKIQYQTMFNGIIESLDKTLQEMINDNDTYSISKIEYNDNYSVFDVTLDTDTVGYTESLSVFTFYMYGGMYGVFSGNKVDNVVVNFFDPDGNLIQSENSADMEN